MSVPVSTGGRRLSCGRAGPEHGLLWHAIQFSHELTCTGAELFYASIFYLPLLLGLMVDKLK